MTALDTLSHNEKFVMVAENRFAVRVADAIFGAMATLGMRQRRVFIIEHSSVEGI